MTNYFVHNLESDKLELHFDKSAYKALSREQQQEIKRYFLFSKNAEAWVSKAKGGGNTGGFYSVRQIALALGLEDGGTEGEALTRVEQQERRVEKAAYRESLDLAGKATRAFSKAEAKYESRDKSISQRYPSVYLVGSGNYPVAKQRKGIEGHHNNMRELVRQQQLLNERLARANPQHLQQIKSIVYLDNRLKEAEAEWRMWIRRKTEPGYTPEQVEPNINQAKELVTYYQGLIDDLGGITFSKESLTDLGATHVQYRRKWYPIVRLNGKTVTIGRWLGLRDDSTWQIPYVEIQNQSTNWPDAILKQPGTKADPKPKSLYKKGDVVLVSDHYQDRYRLRTIESIGPKNVKFAYGYGVRLNELLPRSYKSADRLTQFGTALSDYRTRSPERYAQSIDQPESLSNLLGSPYRRGDEAYVALLINDLDVMGYQGLPDYLKREDLLPDQPGITLTTKQIQAKAKLTLLALKLRLLTL